MNNNGGNYVYALGLDTAAFASSVEKAKRMFQGLGDSAAMAGNEADEAFGKLRNSIASVAASASFGMFAKQIANVRGEVQQLEVAFETMLGSKQKADALMAQMVELAAKTPFGLQDVTNGAKQLLAFGSASEEVASEITMLGDIAAGLSIPLGDLIYLYGTTRTQGRMFTQDLRQFMSRGIPLAEELAKQFGVTSAEVGELVTAGKVGFPEVQRALQNMTAEGGQFGGLMEKQAQTITGQISALEDEIYQMFNKIGESNEGLISLVLSGASTIVENYEKILDILTVLIAAYGAYKAAIILTAAAQKAAMIAKEAQAFFQLAKGIKTAQEAMVLLNATTRKNPWGLVLSAISAVGAAVWAYCESTEEAVDVTNDLEREIGELEQAARDEFQEVNKLAYAYENLAGSETERLDILNKLKAINPNIVEGIYAEADAMAALKKNVMEYNEAQLQTIKMTALYESYDDKIAEMAELEAERMGYIAELETMMADMAASWEAGTWTPKVVRTFDFRDKNIYGDYYEDAKAVRENARDSYIRFLKNTSLTPEERVRLMAESTWGKTGPTGNKIYEYNVADTEEYPLRATYKAYLNATGKIEELQLEAEKYKANMDRLFESWGVSPYEAVATENVDVTLAEAYRTAQQAWLDAKAAVADADKNRANYTEAQYKQLVEELEAAEKRFKELGGNTSSKAQTEAEKNAKEAAERALMLEYDAQQATIDMMAEGTDKKVAQIELDYRKRADAIAKAEAELVAMQDAALTDAQRVWFNTLRESSAKEYADALNEAIFGDTDAEGAAAIQRMEAERKAWNEYLEEYGTFQERLKAMTIRYNEAIATAQTEGERKMLEAERDAALATFEVQASAWAKDLADKSIAELNKMMQELEKQVKAKQEAFDALESSDSAEAQEYLKTIAILNAQIAELKKQLSGASKKAKGGNWEGAAQVVQGIASAAEDAAGALEGVDDELANTINGMAKFANVAASLVASIAAVKDASTHLETALGVIGLIATAIQVVSTAIGSVVQERNEVEKAIAEFSKRMKELNDELERMRRLGEIDSLKGTIFGEDAFGNLMNNLAVMRDALSELEDVRDRITQRMNGLIGWTIHDVESSFANYEEVLRYLVGERVPELFEGGLTLDKLKTWRDTDGWAAGISYDNRELIDELIADWERYEEAVTTVNDYLTDIFGEMGNSINDAIVEAFMNGSDAALEFGDIAGEVIENLIKQVGYSAYIAPILTQAMADVEALNGQGLSAEEYLNALMGIVGDAMKVAGENVEAYNEFLENADQYAESVGINTFDSERSAESKGIAQASQDSVDELNGRMTAIQGHTYSLVEGQRQLINDSAQVLRHLAGIESNTAELRQMRLDMAAMRSDISDIATRGIITR